MRSHFQRIVAVTVATAALGALQTAAASAERLRPAGASIDPVFLLASLTADVTGSGTVTSTPAGISCPPRCTSYFLRGTSVSFAEAAAPGWSFAGWGGTPCGVSPTDPCSAIADGASRVLGRFQYAATAGPRISITAPAFNTFFEFPAEAYVAGTIGHDEPLDAFCVRDGGLRDVIPRKCTQLDQLRLNAFRVPLLNLSPGTHTVVVYARDRRGRFTSAATTLRVAAVSDLDLSIPRIEISQGIQKTSFYDVTSSGSNGITAAYRGVRLAAAMPTVVRVFPLAIAGPRYARTSVSRISVGLWGFDSSGRQLPGSPRVPYENPRDIALHPPFDPRGNAAGGYVFTLPDSWTRAGEISLTASVNPSAFAPVHPEANRANNLFRLTGIRFENMRLAAVAPLEVCWWQVPDGVPRPTPMNPHPSGGRWICPQDAPSEFASLKKIMPTGMVGTESYQGWVDATPVAYCNDAWKQQGRCDGTNPDQKDHGLTELVQAWDTHRSPRIGRAIGIQTGLSAGLAPTREWLAVYNAITEGTRPLTSVGHEYFHTLGFWHATNCGAGLDRGPAELDGWPPDGRGDIQGIGLDRTLGSGAPYGPYKILAPGYRVPSPMPANPSEIFDLMSYCANGNEGVTWISTRNWDSVFGRFATGSSRRTTMRTLRPVGPTLSLLAGIDADGSVQIDRVEPGTGERTDIEQGSPFHVRLRDSEGKVLSDMHLALIDEHTHDGAHFAVIAGEVPEPPGTAMVEIARDDATVARRTISPNAPSIKGVSVSKAAGGSFAVSWTASDADNDPLTARIDYSGDGGKTWRPLTADVATTTTRLPAQLLWRAKAGRVRVTVNDGFHDASAVSPPFKAAGHAPRVAMSDPGAKAVVDADTDVPLRGEGEDDSFKALTAKQLRWLDGTRLLGYGTHLQAQLAPGKHVLALVGTDASGRSTRVSAAVVVRPVRPFFMQLSAPKTVSTTASSIVLRVAANEAATLRVLGRNFSVRRAVRLIRVKLGSRSALLEFPLVLSAAGRTTTVKIEIERRER